MLIIENESDYDILNYYNVDLESQIIEFTEKVQTPEGNWIHSLILLGDDFGIIVFMKEEMAPQNLLEYLD
ncbi:hypothetical protein [Fusibacter sp. JL216-2]|uniref:hypothetical protein n=1 Tax=Fusibacter sp. JL216-2 TaxID=3071453 RepID=UPI003D357A1C